mgnify:FL=1
MKQKETDSIFMCKIGDLPLAWETENSTYPEIEIELKTNGFYWSKSEQFLILKTYK